MSIFGIFSGEVSQVADVGHSLSRVATGTSSISADAISERVAMGFHQDTFTPSSSSALDVPPSIETVSISPGNVSSSADRAAKIEQIRAQISKGTYEVPSSEVAKAMLRKGLFNSDLPPEISTS